MEECWDRKCSRPAVEEYSHKLCRLHGAMWDTDAERSERISAAEELLPPMIRIATVCANLALEEALLDLQVKMRADAEIKGLEWDLLHIEEDMDLD